MTEKPPYTREFMELLAENIPAMAAYIDRDHRYVFTNGLYLKELGLESSEVVGKAVQEVLGEANYEAIKGRLEDALAGQHISSERDIPLGNGTSRHFHGDYLPHCDEQGRVLGCFVLIHDLATSRTTTAKLGARPLHLADIAAGHAPEPAQGAAPGETEQIKSDAIIAAIGDGIAILDRDFKILYQNTVHKDFGRDHRGLFCSRAFGDSENSCPDCPVEKTFLDGKIHTSERTAKNDPGVTLEITASPIRASSGNIIAGIEVVRDITELKKGEQALKKANLELEQLLNTVANGIAMIDKDKNIMRVNQAMLTMSHLSEAETIGRKCHDLFQIPACNTEECPLQRIIAGEPFVRIEGERQCLDGSRFPCEVTAKPLLDIDGNLIGMVEATQDLTEKKKLEGEAELLLKQAIHSEKLAALGTVVAGVAHEINNPNSFISYNAPMAEKIWQGVKPVLDEYAANNPQWRVGHFSYQELTDSMAETLQFIRTGSERINGIVKSLKEFAGQDKEQDDALIQVNDIINHAYTIIGGQIKKKVGTIAINLAADLPEIYGQFQRVEQVVVNLILNAMAALSDKKTGRLTVTTKYNARLQAVLIIVEDNGDGIKKDAMNLIFDPFFTTQRDKGGTGLGLSVSFGLIKEHNGTISVLSLPGKGTRFTVYLPLDKRTQKEVDISPTVLCIDDDKSVLRLVGIFFKKAITDISLATLDNPQHILTYLDDHPEVELVLSDVSMPNMNGWDLLTEIKNKFPLMPMVLFSGNPMALIQPDGAPSPEHILHKPFGLKEIKAIVNSIDRRIV